MGRDPSRGPMVRATERSILSAHLRGERYAAARRLALNHAQLLDGISHLPPVDQAAAGHNIMPGFAKLLKEMHLLPTASEVAATYKAQQASAAAPKDTRPSGLAAIRDASVRRRPA